MMNFLIDIDSQLLLFLNDCHTEYMDVFWRTFTGRFIWIPMYAALLVTVLRNCGWRRGLLAVAFVVLAIAVSDQYCGSVLRDCVGRLRPSNPDNPFSAMVQTVGGYRGGRFGFPSCHAANSFALATFCAMMLRSRRAGAFLVLWAVCNSYSRLYLGVHYPGDIFVGMVFGFLFGGLCYVASERVGAMRAYSDRPLVGRVRTSDLVIIAGLATVAVIAVLPLF